MASLILFESDNTQHNFTVGTVHFYTRDVLVNDLGCVWLHSRSSDFGNGYNDGSFSGAFSPPGWGGDPASYTNGIMFSAAKAGGVNEFYSGGASIRSMVEEIALGTSKTLYSGPNGTGAQWRFDGSVAGQYTITVSGSGNSITISGFDAGGQYMVQMPHLCAFVNHTDFEKSPYNGANIGFYIITHNDYQDLYCCGAFSYGSIVPEIQYRPDPGEKGFIPTGAYTDDGIPGIGGRGTTQKTSPDYDSDLLHQPGAPDESAASAVKSGFLKVYKMSQSELNKICSALYSDTLLDAIKSTFVNPLDFIVSLMVFPTSPNLGATENLTFGKWTAISTGGVLPLGVDITGARLANEFKVINFGTVQIPENWGNFLDYSQTSIELYLPFVGSVNIDASECMGGSINVQYTIDFFTGMCVANVFCERSFNLPSGKLIPNRAQHAYQGNCAIQIPLSAANYGSMVGSLINACTQGISNPIAGFAGIASDAIAGGLRPNISSKGNIVANSGFCSVLYPYVRITRPITAEPKSYQEVMGYPSYINTTLGQCEDLCICDEIDLKGITGATEEELNRIRQLCKDGVYV